MYDKLVQEGEDRAWRKDGERRGWTLPPKAHWFLRLPLIRGVRFMWLAWKVDKAAYQWGQAGIGLGHANERDEWVLYAISRGWC